MLKVQIVNAQPGEAGYTGQNRAARLIKSRRAFLVTSCAATGLIASIRLAERVISQEARLEEMTRKAIANGRYDAIVGTGKLNQRQARGLPFAGNIGRLGLSA